MPSAIARACSRSGRETSARIIRPVFAELLEGSKSNESVAGADVQKHFRFLQFSEAKQCLGQLAPGTSNFAFRRRRRSVPPKQPLFPFVLRWSASVPLGKSGVNSRQVFYVPEIFARQCMG